jgi:DNA-binding GntR family transcriptional regulator
MSSLHFGRIERESITSKVHDNLREQILSGRLTPGTHLLESTIADQMQVSRSPVREAFRWLERDGLIELRSNQGAFVRSLSPLEISEVYTVRALLEGYAAALAAEKAEEKETRRLRESLERVLALARGGDVEATLAADFDMHRLVWELARHQLLYQLLCRLEVQIRMFLAVQAPLFEDLYSSVQSHIEIIEAIERREPAAARETMEKHITEAGTLTLSRLRASPPRS